METIIEPIERSILEAELSNDRFLRKTSFGSNLLYTINHHNAPHVMLEIGRLREIAFREAGGGTGKSADIDEYDTHEKYPYQQLIVWDPTHKQILGGYRYILCNDARDEDGVYHLATKGLFTFSETFNKHYLPYVIELGRSFVHHEYQSSTHGRKGIFVLDNLWEGLGAVMALNQQIKYLFGKVTMYLHYDKLGRDYILYFMKKNFGDKQGLLFPKVPLEFHHNEEELATVFTGATPEDDFKILFHKVRELKHNIPPLISSYVNLSNTMKSFGTALNRDFGDVEETGILVTRDEIVPDKLERYIYSYKKESLE